MPEKNEELSRREVTTEEHSFDELARRVADSTLPRSKALKSVFAAIVGGELGMFMLAPREPDAAKKRQLKSLWANIQGDGLTTSYKGLTGNTRTAEGRYVISFNRDVSKRLRQ